jgi:hypothetical protein
MKDSLGTLGAIFGAFGLLFIVVAFASSNKINLQQQALQPVTNSAVFATHNQIQQASDLRCASQNGTQAYTCAPCPLTGSCVSGIGPNPFINQVVYGMELQFIVDSACVSTRAPFPCTVNVDNFGPLSVFINNGSTAPTPATFGPGFHRIAADQIGSQLVWRLEY